MIAPANVPRVNIFRCLAGGATPRKRTFSVVQRLRDGNWPDGVKRHGILPLALRNEHTRAEREADPHWSRVSLEMRTLGPESPAAVQVKAELKKGLLHPADILQAAITRKEAPLDVVCACLQAYYELVKNLPRSQMLERINAKPITGVALKHLWSDDGEWAKFVTVAKQAQAWLCYFAVAEDLGDYIYDWLKCDIPFAEGLHMSDYERIIWRGLLFRNLIKAHLAHARGAPADAALSLFYGFIDIRRQAWLPFGLTKRGSTPEEAGLPQWLTMSEWPASYELSQSLGKGTHPRTDAALYDRFLNHLEWRHQKGTSLMQEISIARLHLYHPVHPSAQSALIFLRRLFEDKTLKQVRALLPNDPGGLNVLRYTIAIAAQVAANNGAHDDAAWLARKKSELFPISEFHRVKAERSAKRTVRDAGATPSA